MQRSLGWLVTMLTLVTVAVLYVSLKVIISDVERSIEAAAASRGVDLQWERLSWALDSVSVLNVKGEHSRFSVHVAELRIKFSAFDWYDSRPRISIIDVVEPQMTLSRSKTARHQGTQPAGQYQDQVLGLKAWADLGIDLVRFHGGTLTFMDDNVSVFKSEIIDGHIDLSERDPSFLISARYKTAWSQYATARASGVYRTGAPFQKVVIQPMVSGERLFQLNVGMDRYAFDQVVIALKTANLAESKLTVKTVSLKRGRLSADLDQVTISGGLSKPFVQIDGADISTFRPKVSDLSKPAGGSVQTRRLPAVKLPRLLTRFFDKNGRLSWTQVALKIDQGMPVLLHHGTLGPDWADVALSLDSTPLELALDWDRASGLVHTVQWATRGLQLASLVDALAFYRPLSTPSRLGLAGVVSGQGVFSLLSDGLSPQRFLIFDGQIQLNKGGIDWAPISPKPLSNMRLDVSATGIYDTVLDAANSDIGLSSGQVSMDVDAQYRGYGRNRRLELVGASPEVDCQTAIDSLPTGLLGGYSKVRMSGQMKPWFRFRWPFARPNMIRLKFKNVISGCRVDALNADESVWPRVTFAGKEAALDDVDWLKRRFILTLDEGVYGSASIQVGPGTRAFHSIGRMPKHVGGAAYLSEEILFPRNNPIDRGLISRAVRLNLLGRRFVYGGSTVTQQLVKNLFLTRDKSIARKVQEVLIAKRITQKISRRRVLELYLNCIEFGRNLYGISRASYYYFQRSPARLRPRESIFLAMIKPAPRHAPRMRRRGRTPPFAYWQARAEVILQRLIDHDFVSPEEAERDRPLDIEWTNGKYVEPTRIAPETKLLGESPQP
ncbi:MAG: biosynthetic peptidoglycan transglycosylase [Myxococcota bacterium]|nr:biosynthetic peptidoglycan transglycosylase [Myxococcota bacterium]